MVIEILMQTKQINIDEIGSFGFIGELSLNEELRPCTGVLPMVIEAERMGIKNLLYY